MGMKRLTYDAKGKHYCDYETREIINRLAECEIMLEKIEQIIQNTSITDGSNDYAIAFIDIKRVVEDGKID